MSKPSEVIESFPPITVDGWVEYIGQWAEKKGWNEKPRDFSEWTALFHSELSEAYEEFRNLRQEHEIYFNHELTAKPEGIPIELVDCIIRIMHFFSLKNLSLQQVLEMKMAYNETRSHRHGGKVT